MANANKEMTPEEKVILEAKREYHRDYYRRNRKERLAKHKEWRENNPDKVKAANERYWLKRSALKQG